MNHNLLIIWLLAALSLGACNRDKSAAVDAAATPAGDTAVVINNDAPRPEADGEEAAEEVVTTTDAAATPTDLTVYQDQGYRAADQVTRDLNLTDPEQVRRVRQVYATRAQRLGEADRRYATDTTGRYAAVRRTNADADNEIKTIVNDETRYRTYTTNRGRYYGDEYYSTQATTETSAATTTTATASSAPTTRPARRRGPAIVEYKKDEDGDVKIKYANGKQVKIDADGDRKTEYPSGRKVKRDADNGTVKVKD